MQAAHQPDQYPLTPQAVAPGPREDPNMRMYKCEDHSGGMRLGPQRLRGENCVGRSSTSLEPPDPECIGSSLLSRPPSENVNIEDNSDRGLRQCPKAKRSATSDS